MFVQMSQSQTRHEALESVCSAVLKSVSVKNVSTNRLLFFSNMPLFKQISLDFWVLFSLLLPLLTVFKIFFIIELDISLTDPSLSPAPMSYCCYTCQAGYSRTAHITIITVPDLSLKIALTKAPITPLWTITVWLNLPQALMSPPVFPQHPITFLSSRR